MTCRTLAVLVLPLACSQGSGLPADAGDATDVADAGDADCGPGRTSCGGSCVDLTTDPEHCGGCDRECAPGDVCNEGACASSCDPGLTDCGGSCVDLRVDPASCGRCDRACAAGETCAGGACRVCAPACAGRQCGLDGCGGSCPPGCEVGESCTEEGACVLADCFPWSGSPSLQAAVDAYDCVEVQAGTWRIDGTLNLPGAHTLRGVGRDAATLGPGPSFAGDALIVASSSEARVASLHTTGFRPDGVRLPLVLVALLETTTGVVFDDLLIDGAGCDGVSMGARGTTLRRSRLADNGGACRIGIGSAVYAETGGAQQSRAPRILDNLIEDNPGTGIDTNNVDEGEIRGNTIRRNRGPGGIAVYQGHGWTIAENDIQDSGGDGNRHHPYCHVTGTVGIWICRDQDVYGGADGNRIEGNWSRGDVGILLIGADETAPYLVPRNNTLTGNDVFGSVVGCRDDYLPGQWTDGDNVWTGNNCRGTPDTGPDYF